MDRISWYRYYSRVGTHVGTLGERVNPLVLLRRVLPYFDLITRIYSGDRRSIVCGASMNRPNIERILMRIKEVGGTKQTVSDMKKLGKYALELEREIKALRRFALRSQRRPSSRWSPKMRISKVVKQFYNSLYGIDYQSLQDILEACKIKDEELDQALSEWLWDRSNAYWTKDE